VIDETVRISLATRNINEYNVRIREYMDKYYTVAERKLFIVKLRSSSDTGEPVRKIL